MKDFGFKALANDFNFSYSFDKQFVGTLQTVANTSLITSHGALQLSSVKSTLMKVNLQDLITLVTIHLNMYPTLLP